MLSALLLAVYNMNTAVVEVLAKDLNAVTEVLTYFVRSKFNDS